MDPGAYLLGTQSASSDGILRLVLRRTLAFTLVLACLLGGSSLFSQVPSDESFLPTLSTGTASLVLDGREVALPMSETVLGPLFSLPDLMTVLGGELIQGPLLHSFRMRLFDEEVVLGAGSHVITVGQEIVRISQAPRLGEGGIQVPLDLLKKTLGLVLHYDFVWSEVDRRLFAMPQQTRDVGVSWNLVHLQGISTLVLQFEERPRYRVVEGADSLSIEFLGGERALVAERQAPLDPLVRDVSFEGDLVRISTAPNTTVDHYEQSRPFRLVFDLYQRQGSIDSSAPLSVDSTRRTRSGRMIVIDPGHGGSETGAVGPSGVEEKALTLQLSRTLARRLESRLPVQVVLTRETDADLALDRRTAIANQHQADLFISVHLNSSVGSTAQGAETYFLSLDATDEAAAAAAQSENQSGGLTGETMQGLELILWDLSQSRYLAQSQRLGRLVQSELNEALGLRDRGVKQAPFRVLMGAAMPAVLVELGFVSNPEEETKLRRVSYQAELVDALVRAVSRFYGQAEAEGADREVSKEHVEAP